MVSKKSQLKITPSNATSSIADSAIADSFRRWGYLAADLDVLCRLGCQNVAELDGASGEEADRLREIYCGKLGIEFMHMPQVERREWLAQRLENGTSPQVDQRFVLQRILLAESFERFIHTRYVGSKRFSIEGLAALIPLLDSVLERAADEGFETVMLGMAHRGRLSTLLSIIGSSAQNIFACFEDVDPQSVFGSGDVKYHRGGTGIYRTRAGKELRVHLASNPSHLEFVNPVLMGRVKARQDRLGDTKGEKVLCVLIHGDAAFAGQGVTAETLNLANVAGFSVGGTVHIIANNLVGFTTPASAYQSTPFCTDIAKRLPIPIFHVNAESPDDVCSTGDLAMAYRSEFSSEVVIDLIGYRRHGHNEGDDPSFTMPTLYDKITKHPYLYQEYAEQIGVSAPDLQKLEEEVMEKLSDERDKAKAMTKQPVFFQLPDYWQGFVGGEYSPELEVETKVDAKTLATLAEKLASAPKDFEVHPKLVKLLEQRLEMGTGKRSLDYAMAEALAFASLVTQGVPVRLTGQDTRRGTFSHRHSVLFDYKTGKEHTPLNSFGKQATFSVYDSVLSEAALVGFEYGYSRDFPEALVLWEAQFGDFVNGAQVLIDQFLTAGEDKWNLLSGLVMLLPHGYEGNGPEHSSARPERFLQLAAEDNIQVAQPSTAAQYFHMLRRQALRKWRKPLIVMTPKSMLRAAPASSPISQLSEGKFFNVLDDAERRPDAERLIICTGKIVHELRTEREKRGDHDTAIVTLEQLYPFPENELAEILDSYPRVQNVVYVQEEPANMGALTFVRPYLEQLADRGRVSTVRRSASASPATGSAKAHEIEQQTIIKLAFSSQKP